MLECLDLPKGSIFQKFIPKKSFYNHGDLTTSERNLFVNHIEKITLYAQLTRANTNIPLYKDEERSYEEVSVFQLELRRRDKLDRIVRIIMESIPYPMILIAKDLDYYKFYGAHQRDNLVDRTKIILEEIYQTDFLLEDHEFIQKIDYKELNKMNFYQLYDDYIQQIINYNLEKRKIKTVDNRAELLAEIEAKEEMIQSLRSQLRREKHFNKKMELNMQIKKIELELKQMEVKDD